MRLEKQEATAQAVAFLLAFLIFNSTSESNSYSFLSPFVIK
ncbi:hypothetical protein SORDD05_01421 [Streptococcus oralis]|uniref:Uncharacterized protein n=1 Tax=Streptococcus oralis TaxID=1303 RepID=A0A139M8B7_STROR|nr:hypothetical protein SORDD05_01421 [Streptococcus oralis]